MEYRIQPLAALGSRKKDSGNPIRAPDGGGGQDENSEGMDFKAILDVEKSRQKNS